MPGHCPLPALPTPRQAAENPENTGAGIALKMRPITWRRPEQKPAVARRDSCADVIIVADKNVEIPNGSRYRSGC